MAEGTGSPHLSKEEVKKMLECPVCYEVILPPIFLCWNGHSICNKCLESLDTCPNCRSCFTRVRNRFAEDLHDKFKVKCRYEESGCQVEMKGRELVDHQEDCNYRPLLCWECVEEIPYHKFLDHLRDVEKVKSEELTHCRARSNPRFQVCDEDILEYQTRNLLWGSFWIKARGQHFFCRMGTIDSNWFIWVASYLTPEECSKFSCSITVWNYGSKKEMKYVGKVHTLRAWPEDVFTSGSCLSFNDVNVKHLIRKDRIRLVVTIETVDDTKRRK